MEPAAAGVEDAMARLAWAISTGDRRAFAAAHVAGATWDDGQGRSLDALAWFDGWRASPVSPGHQLWLDNVRVRREGEHGAVASAYLMAPYFGQTMVPATLVLAVAQVEDHYVASDGGWKLAARTLAGWPFPEAPAVPTPAPDAAEALPPGWRPPPADDRAAVLDLYADYAWTLDTGDADGFVALLTPDVLMTDPGGEYRGHAQVRAFLDELHGHNHSFPGRQHWIGSPWLRQVADDRMECDVFVCVPATFAHGPINLDIVGCYQDVLVRREDGWKFAQRLILPWTGALLRGFPRYAPIGGVA